MAIITVIRNPLAAKRMMRSVSRLAATAGLGLSICVAAHAQSVTSSITTGAVIPENEALAVPPTTTPTRSQTFNLGVTVGLGETDNVAQTPTGERAQTIALTGIDFGWQRTGSALDANVVGNFDYLNYLQGEFGSQLLGRFDGQTSLRLFDDHLQWFLQDDFGEGQLNAYSPATPGNLEQVNYFMTGPEVTLRPGSDTEVQFGARYGVVTYQTDPFDGTRASENVLLERLLSQGSNVALGAEAEELRFDNTIVNSDYDRSRFYVRYNVTGARTQLTAAVGETQNDDGGRWVAAPLVQLDLTHALTAQSALTVSAGREFTDAADAFGDLRTGATGGIIVAPVALTTEDYLRNYVSAGLQASGLRTTVGANAYWERDTYAIDDAFNVTRGSVELLANRQLNTYLSTEMYGALTQSRYFDQDGQITTYTIGAAVAWQVSRMLSVEGRYAHNFQSTSGAGYGFSANTVFLTVTYRPLLSVEQQKQQQQLQQQQQQPQ
jgi:hypothetical protein